MYVWEEGLISGFGWAQKTVGATLDRLFFQLIQPLYLFVKLVLRQGILHKT